MPGVPTLPRVRPAGRVLQAAAGPWQTSPVDIPDDPFAMLSALPGVPEGVERARACVDSLRGHRAMRRLGPAVAAESGLRAARASAALAGVDVTLGDMRAGNWPAGRPGQVAAAAVRVVAETARQLPVWPKAPLQALAALHVAAASDVLPAELLGRPRPAGTAPGPEAGDPVESLPSPRASGGPWPDAQEVAARLDLLIDLLSRPTEAPAVVVAAVVHGELMALRPFAAGNGLVARAAARLVGMDRGLDPAGVAVPEAGFALDSPQEYVEAVASFASGRPAAVAAWILRCADAYVAGAQEGFDAADLVADVP